MENMENEMEARIMSEVLLIIQMPALLILTLTAYVGPPPTNSDNQRYCLFY